MADKGNGKKRKGLTDPQEAAAIALASGATQEAAARASDTHVTSIKRWNADPVFRARVRELRDELTERVLGRLTEAAASAVNTLLHLSLRGKTEGTRLKASDSILNHCFRIKDNVEMAERLKQLAGGGEDGDE